MLGGRARKCAPADSTSIRRIRTAYGSITIHTDLNFRPVARLDLDAASGARALTPGGWQCPRRLKRRRRSLHICDMEVIWYVAVVPMRSEQSSNCGGDK